MMPLALVRLLAATCGLTVLRAVTADSLHPSEPAAGIVATTTQLGYQRCRRTVLAAPRF